jgi:hypothetical protein
MYQTQSINPQRLVGGTITTSGYADNGPSAIPNLGNATDRVRNISGRLGLLLDALTKVEASLFGPSPECAETMAGVPSPSGQIAELHQSVGYAEEILARVEAVASRLHSI